MLYLPDTNILIYALSGQEPYASWLVKNVKEKTILLSAIVVSEYLSGVIKDEEIAFRGILENVEVAPVDSLIAQVGASYRREYIKKRKKVWLFDCLIAATCKIYSAVLVTSDSKDYPMKDIEVITKI